MNEHLLEPLKYYNTIASHELRRNATEHFDALLEESGVNLNENRRTVKKYNEQQEKVSSLNKKISKFKTIRGFLIAGIVIGAILTICGIFLWPLLLAGIPMIGLCIFFMVAKVNPIIKNSDKTRSEHVKKVNELLSEAEGQVAPLMSLFDDGDTYRIIEKTVPEFSFNLRFNKDHENFLAKLHDFIDLNGANSSVSNTVAGSFAGNPFLIVRRRIHEMRQHTYQGSLNISWTETYRDSNGKLQTRVRTQTLYANVTKPMPYYYYTTELGYGCQAAPDLTFDRIPKHSENLSEKALAKKVRSGEKKLKKLSDKATADGKSFQEMANSEFEVLFDATNRNHEVQFRLMYTPLAQQNTVELLTDKSGFGDDFRFSKRRRYNIITSEHLQNNSMSTSPSNYRSHSADIIKDSFIAFNESYFKALFFAFAPLLSVPAYLDSPSVSMEPFEDPTSNFTYYEHEVMANIIGKSSFVHSDSRTDAILKTNVVSKNGNTDSVNVTAYSYTTVERIDYIPVYGGDGRYHNVPVPWTEYIPVSRTRTMYVENTDKNRREIRESINSGDNSLPSGTYYHGLAARIS